MDTLKNDLRYYATWYRINICTVAYKRYLMPFSTVGRVYSYVVIYLVSNLLTTVSKGGKVSPKVTLSALNHRVKNVCYVVIACIPGNFSCAGRTSSLPHLRHFFQRSYPGKRTYFQLCLRPFSWQLFVVQKSPAKVL